MTLLCFGTKTREATCASRVDPAESFARAGSTLIRKRFLAWPCQPSRAAEKSWQTQQYEDGKSLKHHSEMAE